MLGILSYYILTGRAWCHQVGEKLRNIIQVYLQTVRGFDDSDCVRSLNLVQIIVAAKLSSSLEDQSEGREGF